MALTARSFLSSSIPQCRKAVLSGFSGRNFSGKPTSKRDIIQFANRSVNALVHVADKQAPVDTPGPLSGISIAVKDNICTSSMPTTCASAMLAEFTAPYDATVVKLMCDAAADLVGKANCDEFGMGSLNTHSIHGAVVNPFKSESDMNTWVKRERRSAGGSSGGSAAAVAIGMCDAALGTDTGGSIRLPASYCGVVGFKPSYGLISRYGVVSFADSLDCVGILAKDISTIEVLNFVISQFDPLDPTAAPHEVRKKARGHLPSRSPGRFQRIRIGIPQEYFPSELSSSVYGPLTRVLSALKQLGGTLVPVSLPSTPYALSAYYVIASAEASSNMARYDGVQYGLKIEPGPLHAEVETGRRNIADLYARTRSAGFGPEVRKRILLGTYALRAGAFDNYFQQALRVRQLIRDDFNRVFRAPDVRFNNSVDVKSNDAANDIDFLVHPTAIGGAPRLTEETAQGGLDAYVQDVLTVPASLAGLPAVSLPVPGRSHKGDEWPLGVSFVGQWGSDEAVLGVARDVQEVLSRSALE